MKLLVFVMTVLKYVFYVFALTKTSYVIVI